MPWNVRFWLRKGVDHEFSGNFVPFVAKKQNHYKHENPQKILSRQVDALRRSSAPTAALIHHTLLWPIYAEVDRQRERCFDTLRRTVEGGFGNGLFVAAGGDAAVPASGVGLRDSLVFPVQPLRVALPRHLPASPHRPPAPGRTPDRPVPGADGFRYSARVRI